MCKLDKKEGDIEDKCANRNKITKTIARPTPIGTLCILANMIKTIKTILPKAVSNKLTNNSGTANITSHNATNKLKRPTIKFCVY